MIDAQITQDRLEREGWTIGGLNAWIEVPTERGNARVFVVGMPKDQPIAGWDISINQHMDEQAEGPLFIDGDDVCLTCGIFVGMFQVYQLLDAIRGLKWAGGFPQGYPFPAPEGPRILSFEDATKCQ